MRSLISILVALFLFVSINLFAGTALRFQKVDLTENDLYSLADGTRAILEKIEEPVVVRFFHSEAVTADIPSYDTFARRTRELLEEFEEAADGKLVLQVIDPEPFSEEKELARASGIRGQLASAGGEMLYLGISITNSVDEQETLPVLRPQEESRLEYELARRIYALTQDSKQKVAVVSSLPLEGGPANPFGGPPPQPWRLLEILRELYEVEVLDPAAMTGPIDAEVDVLLLAHPKGLPELARFAIDQYAVGGGKVLAFVDPYCFFDAPPPGQQNQFGHQRTSQLDSLLSAWGVEMTPSKVVGDRNFGKPVQTGPGTIVNFPLLMELNASVDPAVFDEDDFVTADLSVMMLYCAGELRAVEDARPEVTPILFTSESGRAVDATSLQYAPDPRALAGNLAEQFRSGDFDRVTLGVRVSGPIPSAFPEGAPDGWEGGDEPLTEGEAFNAVVVADADLLHEGVWTTTRRTQFGLMEGPNDNPSLVLNAVDNLCGSNDLLSLRSRDVSSRPLTKKQEIADAARERWQEEDEKLREKSRELDAEIAKLLEGTPNEDGQIFVSVQQAEELRDKQQEQLEVIREQNRVQYQLSKDIDDLGVKLKAINIGVVPGLVVLLGLAFHLVSRFTRSARRN